jgi:hypothetical protein
MRRKADDSVRADYNVTLEAYYSDLLLEQKAGRVSAETHKALDTFLRELRQLVSEVNSKPLAKAA